MPGPMHRMPNERSSIVGWLQDNPMATFIGMAAVVIVLSLIAYKYSSSYVASTSATTMPATSLNMVPYTLSAAANSAPAAQR